MERREFIQLSAGLGVLPVTFPVIEDKIPSAKERNKTVVLFQGDSITDSGRDKKSEIPDQPGSLGHGYAFLSAVQLYERYPYLHPQVYNRGISGNKVFQLADRWDIDAFLLEPEVLSILIGVNDHWHSLRDYKGTPEIYERDFDALLRKTTDQLPNVKLIIGEPFVLLEGSAIEKDKWMPVFGEYQEMSKKLADRYGAVYVPFQSVFDKALNRAPSSYWSIDGVHPTLAGSQLMANAWMESFAKLKW